VNVAAGGYTVTDLARRFRVSEEKVRAWLRSGALRGLNVGDIGGRVRFVVTPESLADFEAGRSVAEPPKTPRRKKRPARREWY
jgi:hypothetical protein